MLNAIFDDGTKRSSFKIGITFGSKNINISNRKSRIEILLPSKASMWEDQVMVDVNRIDTIKTKEDFDYYIILEMYDGREISIKYSFSSYMKKDLDKIMKLRSSRPRSEGVGFYFKF